MCIICNISGAAPDEAGFIDGCEKANRFLSAFSEASAAMRRATDAMLACSRIDRQYDATHKKMVNACRDWNRLEEQREAGHEPKQAH